MRSRSCERPARRGARRQAGFAYIALMIAVATIGLAAAATLQAGSLLARREAEQALLDCGRDFRAALDAVAGGVPPLLPEVTRFYPCAKRGQTRGERVRGSGFREEEGARPDSPEP